MTETRLLSGYRAVEVGGVAGMFCGKMLADLGVEVLRIEPPTGDPQRAEPPLVPWDGASIGAAWLAYNTSKRSVALDIESAEGRLLLDRLLAQSDLLIADGPPAWLEAHGLTPHAAREGRPRLVALAITPFGLAGPYRDYQISDLVAQSGGGFVYTNGDRDRPPVRISEEQSWPLAGAEAAFVSVAELFGAGRDGIGEGIDLSIHEAVVAGLVSIAPWWQLEQRIPERNALTQMGREILIRNIWPCKDGLVTFRVSVGQGLGNRNLRLIEWMEEEGEAGDLLAVAWEYMSTLEITQEQVAGWQETFERFFAKRTKDELYAGARQRRVLLFPILEFDDILANEHLAQRRFWATFTDIEGREARFPGPLFRAVPGADPAPAPPPALGADTADALATLACCDAAEIDRLRTAGVIR